jgi:RNA polymerase sigma-70 factor (ECF subfamily)
MGVTINGKRELMKPEGAEQSGLAEDAALIRGVAEGDHAAFERLLDKYRKPVFSVALRMLGRAEDAEDVTQETFIQAYRHAGTFEGRSRVSTWLFQIAVNRALNVRRRARNSPIREMREGVEHASPVPPPEKPALEKEFRGRLMDAVAKLPPDQAEAFMLREIEDLSYKEMADSIGAPIGTVMSRLSRARETLRVNLKEYME